MTSTLFFNTGKGGGWLFEKLSNYLRYPRFFMNDFVARAVCSQILRVSAKDA